jgi:Superfamily II DNA/RNA helicases, SNF2 family
MSKTKKPLRLRKFQREDVNKIKRAKIRALLASSMGSGKTAVSIRAIYEKHKRTFPALVLCPASVTENWAREIEMWAPGIRIVLVDDMESRIPRFRDGYTFYVMSWALLDARLQDLRKLRLRSVIGDECHYIKNADTLRSKAFAALTYNIPHLLLLSGTPIVNTKAELGVIKGYFGSSDPLMIRRLLEDVAPDIPPKKRSYLHVRLRDKHQVEYDKANEEFEDWLREEKEKLLGQGLAEYEVERTLAAEALAKVGYLRRLVGKHKCQRPWTGFREPCASESRSSYSSSTRTP